MTRILTAAVLIPLIVWAVLWAPSWAFLLVIALVGLGAFKEFEDIAASQGIAPTGLLGMGSGIVFLLAADIKGTDAMFTAVPLLALIAIVLMISKLKARDLSTALPSVGTALLGIVYIFGAWRCAILLRGVAPHWLMIALLVSWAGDTAAMYVGKAWGKNKLAPRISPGKTVEGAIASAVGGTLIAVLYAHFFVPQAEIPTVMIIGALANIAGQLGDLCESAFKRGANVKDSGTMLPGHGGWLDRIDSTLFSVPVVCAAVRVLGLWPGDL